MLEAKELKLVISTLTKRRAWLLKSLEDTALDESQRQELRNTIKLLDSSLKKLAKLGAARTPAAPAVPTPPPRKTKRKTAIDPEDAYVLIAEDNIESAQLLRDVLEDMKIGQIEHVEDGRSAVYALQNASPPFDIVLCDWDMPEMNGLEVRKAVKNLAKLQDTHFVMVTGVSEAGRIREAIQHGVDDYIVKPVDINVLEGKLRAALAAEEPPKEDPAVAKK